jgi:hypothetical protein
MQRPALKADNLTAIYEPTVQTMLALHYLTTASNWDRFIFCFFTLPLKRVSRIVTTVLCVLSERLDSEEYRLQKTTYWLFICACSKL